MTSGIIINDKLFILPEKPGVYQFYSESCELLYVGKAKNLRKRAGSYFIKNEGISNKLRVLVSKIVDIKYIIVDTESDALLLENNLIKKYKPRYNILLKDDKTYPWICIKNEPYPRVFSTRSFVNDGSIYYGPYTSGFLVKTLLDLIRKLYTVRTCKLNLEKDQISKSRYKPCLEYQIGNCLAPCIGNQTETDYNQNIAAIHFVLKGNLHNAQKWLSEKMINASKNYLFEEANLYKTKLEILKNYQSKTTIVSNKVTNIDVFTLYEKTGIVAVNYLKVVNGSIIQSYTLELKKNLDEAKEELLGFAITEIRSRVNSGTKKIVVPFKPDFLIKDLKYIVPQRGDLKKLLDLSLRNSTAYIQEIENNNELKNPLDRTNKILETLKKDFRLDTKPIHIECFDNSNLQGTNPVSSCVVFRNAKPAKRDYRHFNVKTVVGSNDFATMEEVVYRRYHRLLEEKKVLPQLVVIDGGKGQLSAALSSLVRLGVDEKIKLIGIAKRLEEIYFSGDPVPIYLNKNSVSLKIIQHLRNEAHRFGVKHHVNKRDKGTIKSELDDIEGIGEKTKQLLFDNFKTIYGISIAKQDILERLIGNKKTEIILRHFKKNIE
ncbi:MAG: excinuclease ABC subunit UvrC [Tenuifilaceae bacterium]